MPTTADTLFAVLCDAFLVRSWSLGAPGTFALYWAADEVDPASAPFSHVCLVRPLDADLEIDRRWLDPCVLELVRALRSRYSEARDRAHHQAREAQICATVEAGDTWLHVDESYVGVHCLDTISDATVRRTIEEGAAAGNATAARALEEMRGRDWHSFPAHQSKNFRLFVD